MMLSVKQFNIFQFFCYRAVYFTFNCLIFTDVCFIRVVIIVFQVISAVKFKMSSETLENLEDGLTKLLDQLKSTVYHQLPELRGGQSVL